MVILFHTICIEMQWEVLKIDSVYKQGKSYYPQAYVEECKYNNAEKKMQHI